MHPDSPIRLLDEIIRRYGVTCLQLTPFDGGGYCVRIGSHVEPVTEGGGSLPEAIGKAFLTLMQKQGRPSFDELLDKSSLGTPSAKRIRAQASKPGRQVHTYENPAVHWPRTKLDFEGAGQYSACGFIRGASPESHAKFTRVLDEVTCGRCRMSSSYRSERTMKRRPLS